MTEESINEKLARLRENIESPQNKIPSRWDNIKGYIKKSALVGAGVLIAGGALTLFLAKDYLTKRQNYPERNVLYRSSNVSYVAGNENETSEGRADRESITKFYAGGGIESKVGTYLFETTRETRGDIKYFNMDNSQKIRIASSSEKPETFQAGLSISGSLNFREQFTEIVLEKRAKGPQNYVVYKIGPERALSEVDIDVVDHIDGKREIFNRLVEKRTFPLGWFFGKERFRAGTVLEDYQKDKDNLEIAKEILDKIRTLDNKESTDEGTREKLVSEIRELEGDMKKITTYSSFEDGFLKAIPCGSSVYLGEEPGLGKRAFHYWIGYFGGDSIRLRVDNHWDLFPGRYPIINRFSIGSGDNKLYLFDKYNNGGYTIRDKFGDIARVDIVDFILKYGQDILYKFYLDLNGDGVLDKENELIGEVLCRASHDERADLEQFSGEKKPDKDTTFTINYSFMSPTSDLKEGKRLLRLCAAIESMMPDQVHRGFGRHSLLGLINDQRSDLMAFEDLSIQNMSRALTQESTLAAKHDVIRVLTATGRPYAEDLARSYNIHDEFKGQFWVSSNLRNHWDFGFLPNFSLFLGIVGAGYFGGRKAIREVKKRRERNKLSAEERLKKLTNTI